MYLMVGGLVGVGFDKSGAYLLTVSHSGRGVFSTTTWQKVARDYARAYPKEGKAFGIGPISGEEIAVAELDSDHDIAVASPDGRLLLKCTSSDIEVVEVEPKDQGACP